MNSDDLEILNKRYKEDFEKALKIYENEYSHNELIEFLKSGSVVEKQIAALKINNLKTKEEVAVFLSNLTGCDGKIREAVSFRLKDFISDNPEWYIEYYEKFLDAIVDINGNICRNTIAAIKFLKNEEIFCSNFVKILIEKTLIIAEEAKDFDIQDGRYKINKQMFKLYWYLETISEFADKIPDCSLEKILNLTKNITDYTIREKTAKILSKIDKFEHLKLELKCDENYYVRRF